MRVTVYGSTGPTGLLIVEKLLARGHEVVAFARTPSKITMEHPSLQIHQGDVYDPASVAEALQGSDAAVSSVGAPYSFKPVSVYSTAARHIVDGMRTHGLRRLVCITSGGTHPGRDPVNPFFFERILKPLFHRLYDDMRAMEEIVMPTDLDWTILRPPRLLDKEETGKVRVIPDTYAVRGGATVSRADLASVLVDELIDPSLVRKAAVVCD